MANFLNKFDAVYYEAIEKIPHLQSWNGHYLVRKIETEILADKFSFDENYVGLELGCGNAFQSALLASLSKRIFATDLFKENKAMHSLGINKAQDLINALNVKNITLISCSAVSLPFVNNYFDFVFSSSVLEHVNDRKSALFEIRRILKPNGYLILIVPTHIASIYAFPHVFLYFLARSLKLVFNSANKSNKDIYKSSKDNLDMPLIERLKRNHPSFPLPEPHGAYANIFKELYQQFPYRWNELIKKSGFKVVKSFPICLVPWLLIEPFSPNIGAQLYRYSKKLHSVVSGYLSFLGYLNCSVAIKNN